MKFAFNTILEFNDYFKDEATCYQWFEQIRWNGVPVCPHCGSDKTPYKVKARGKFADIPSYRCANRACDLPFTVRTKSIFEGSKVELRKWFLAAFELSTDKKGISSIELGVKIGVSQKTAWFLNHRLRAMLKETDPTVFQDVTQVDEAYIGGKNRNRHVGKKHPHSQGRGGKGKTMVFGAVGLLGQVKAQVVQDADRATLFPIINKWIAKDSIMVSDEWIGYYTLQQENYHHVTVNHSIGNWANGAFHTNGVENFWSIFKRGVIGTFHSVSPQHLQAYLDEFVVRHNAKHKTNIERFKNMVERTPNARLKYWQATGKKGRTERFLKYKNDELPL